MDKIIKDNKSVADDGKSTAAYMIQDNKDESSFEQPKNTNCDTNPQDHDCQGTTKAPSE